MKVRVRSDGTAEGTSQTFPPSLYGALVTIPDPPPDPPARSASKAEWVAYATAQGIEDAESFTKDDLVERYG